MWGQDYYRVESIDYYRIIPTRVGTSGAGVLKDRLRKDHPHACGDKISERPRRQRAPGSSPRVWGQEIVSDCGNHIAGIIPTRVGTRRIRRKRCMVGQDHPHACGDKVLRLQVFFCSRGSSPRVWGQVTKKMVDDLKARIIPTRVGTR